jgi:hypothetical protein
MLAPELLMERPLSNLSNFGRVFEEVVSVEAWHSTFDPVSNLATVHADISFTDAKLGAERDCPVRFTLGLRRAEVSLIIPDREPIAVVQSSISRQIGPMGQKTLEITSGRHADGKAEGGLSASPHPLNFELSGSVGAMQSTKSVTSLTEKVGPFMVRHFTKDKAQCWEIFTDRGGTLVGKAWDPVLEPRMKVKKIQDSRLDPSIRIRVRCRREDLAISNLSFKSPREHAGFSWHSNNNKLAAASAYIKARLVHHGLTPNDFDEELSLIFLADAAVTEEIS